MILSKISLLDCIVFVIFLVPQLLIHVGFVELAGCGLRALPFLALRMPAQLIRERYVSSRNSRSPFVRNATLFQDLVIRCVRYAFAYIPAKIGAVFFSRKVAEPFMKFRLLRHGYLRCPIFYTEVSTDPSNSAAANGKGVWVIQDKSKPPDVIVFYCHGGGFSMGSSYFYLEFLMAWLTLLKARQGFHNPAIFALEYTLVPHACFPTQVQEARKGYEFVLSMLPDGDPGRVCLAGDSAGATLVLSLLLTLAQEKKFRNVRDTRLIGHVTMISPWCRLVSENNKDTLSDYLNADSLHLYARQYMGLKTGVKGQEANGSVKRRYGHENRGITDDTFVSPGDCDDLGLWATLPIKGLHFVYGAEEVFAPETEALITKIKAAGGCSVEVLREPSSIHAWPVVNLFLGDTKRQRLKGLDKIVDVMGRNLVF